MTNKEFISVQAEIGLNNRQLGEILGLSRKTIDSYRADPGKSAHRKISGAVECSMRLLFENKKLKSKLSRNRKNQSAANAKYYQKRRAAGGFNPRPKMSEGDRMQRRREYQYAYSHLRRKGNPEPLKAWEKKWNKAKDDE